MRFAPGNRSNFTRLTMLNAQSSQRTRLEARGCGLLVASRRCPNISLAKKTELICACARIVAKQLRIDEMIHKSIISEFVF